MKIGIIGKKEQISAFRALGIKIYLAGNAEIARAKILKLANDSNLAILFVPESIAREIYDTIKKINEQTFPVITIIPDPKGSTGFASKIIRDAMLRAVGTDITKK